MNIHDIELPPLPQGEYRLSPDSRAPTLYDEEAMEAYATAAIEADRNRRGEPVCIGHIYYPATGGNAGIDWTITKDQGVLPRSGEPVYVGSAPQPAEPDLAKCAECGAEMIHVRPGKWQHPDCPQSPRAAEPVKKKDWNVELSSWSDEDFVQVFHERPDLANRLRKILAEPEKVPSDDEILFTMRHIERHLKCIDGAIPTLLSTARALLERYGNTQQEQP